MKFRTKILSFVLKSARSAIAGLTALGSAVVFMPETAFAEPSRYHLNGASGGIIKVHHHRHYHRHHGRRFHYGGRRYYRGHRHYSHRHYKRHRHYHRRHYRRGHGAAVAAGIIGLTAGAIIASQAGRHHHRKRAYSGGRHYEPFTTGWYAACARKYRSFNPETGRYLAYSGKYRLCRL